MHRTKASWYARGATTASGAAFDPEARRPVIEHRHEDDMAMTDAQAKQLVTDTETTKRYLAERAVPALERIELLLQQIAAKLP